MKKQKNSLFPVIYMFIITAFFSAILILFSDYTRPQVKANEQIQIEKAIVTVLITDLDAKTSNREIHRIYTKEITKPTFKGDTYKLIKNGEILAHALPIEGQGFWAPIKGFIGIGPDKKSLINISFYEQNETPGLGAEITQPEFCNQFKIQNNRVLSEVKKPLKIARPGTELKQNEVHAVTGATQTSTRLEKLINDSIVDWRKSTNSGGKK